VVERKARAGKVIENHDHDPKLVEKLEKVHAAQRSTDVTSHTPNCNKTWTTNCTYANEFNQWGCNAGKAILRLHTD
jgi:hypothetical protein